MKSILFISLLFYCSVLYPYSPPDSLNTSQKKTAVDETKKIGEKKEVNFGRKKGKKDAFIDKDGDGICDQRVKGMSFENAQRRHMQRNQGGKKGNGNKNGQ